LQYLFIIIYLFTIFNGLTKSLILNYKSTN